MKMKKKRTKNKNLMKVMKMTKIISNKNLNNKSFSRGDYFKRNPQKNNLYIRYKKYI